MVLIIRGHVNGFMADIWALGVTLYYMVFAKVPFVGQNIPQIYERIEHNEVPFEAAPSLGLDDLLRKLLEKNPSKRIRLDDVMVRSFIALTRLRLGNVLTIVACCVHTSEAPMGRFQLTRLRPRSPALPLYRL
jgi:serine/threonine protein kinase